MEFGCFGISTRIVESGPRKSFHCNDRIAVDGCAFFWISLCSMFICTYNPFTSHDVLLLEFRSESKSKKNCLISSFGPQNDGDVDYYLFVHFIGAIKYLITWFVSSRPEHYLSPPRNNKSNYHLACDVAVDSHGIVCRKRTTNGISVIVAIKSMSHEWHIRKSKHSLSLTLTHTHSFHGTNWRNSANVSKTKRNT